MQGKKQISLILFALLFKKARNLRLTAYNQYVLLNMHALLPLSLTLHYPAIPG